MVNSTLIDIQNLETCFSSKVVLQNLSLSILENEVLVILGGSGSGKSTLLRDLIGLENPTNGHCFFEGVDLFNLRERDWKEYRKKIAYAFQGGALFDSLTVYENLMYPLNEHNLGDEDSGKKKIEEILERFGLSGTESLLPASLSGGMQKRVGIARSLMLDPQVILYDEPTAGLDPTNSRRIAETILSLKGDGKTSIVVTHDIECALKVYDRIAFIKDRKIAALQTRAELEKSIDPIIDAYFKGEE